MTSELVQNGSINHLQVALVQHQNHWPLKIDPLSSDLIRGLINPKLVLYRINTLPSVMINPKLVLYQIKRLTNLRTAVPVVFYQIYTPPSVLIRG